MDDSSISVNDGTRVLQTIINPDERDSDKFLNDPGLFHAEQTWPT